VTELSADEAELDSPVPILCGLAWAAALIHVEAAIGHVGEGTLHVLFFVLVANAQFAWGVLAYRLRDTRLLWAGAVGSVAVVAVWLASRTTGVPVGPDAWQPEPVGLLDSIATADELVLALLVALGSLAVARKVLTGVAVALLLLSSLSLTGGSVHPD
jgi:hypothetical protein